MRCASHCGHKQRDEVTEPCGTGGAATPAYRAVAATPAALSSVSFFCNSTQACKLVDEA